MCGSGGGGRLLLFVGGMVILIVDSGCGIDLGVNFWEGWWCGYDSG